ncbi:reverse transcriptase domain-containing protein [Tanacetum coccineum]
MINYTTYSPLRTESRLRPYHFNYPERSMTIEEMLNKFIDEGKREHEEMREFIYDFQTTNELLFKERNNSLIELRFEVQELLKVINNVLMLDCDAKGVTTRGGKTTTQDDRDNNTNVLPKEPLVVELEKPVRPNNVLTNDQPQMTSEPVVQPSNKEQTPPVPFPRRLRKEKEEAQQKKFLENMKQLHINLPFIEALAQMPKYAKFLKCLLTNKARLEEACKIIINERCSVILLNKLPSKEKDPGSFAIPCDIGQLHIDNALADLGASISLMPYTMYKKLGLGEPKATRMSLELADRSIQYPRGIIKNILIKVDKFVLPVDFVILDMPEDSRVPIILGRPFLATARAMIDVFNKKITLRVGDDEVINEEAQELLAIEEPDSFLSRGLEKSINQSDLECCESASSDGNNESDPENSIRPSANEIDEEKLELKNLPQHLEYAYLHGDKSFPIIISSKLSEEEKISLLRVLEKQKGPIAWKMSDIKGISPSYYSSWVSPIHVVPKKGGMAVVLNDNNELIPSRIVIGWRVCIDFRFFQIPIAPEDQEKITFTCPYGTFAYRRMPFGLGNAPATFQRCMTAIFHDMVEDFMEVFMDDFSVFGNSFDCCLANLDRMLARCEETNLVLNWEKCHCMVKEGIVLGHKISRAGIEVDRAKIDVIAKLPYLTNVKGVRSFLRHAGFYRRFIKDFFKISKPMTQHLMKDAKFDFSNDYKKAFNILKEKLTIAPIIISPDWNVPFKLMCDASDFAVRAVLGKEDAKPRLIRWVLLLQGFDIEIKDKKGAENLVADHLSRLENPDLGTLMEEEITDEFLDEHLTILKAELNNDEPWYADYINYIVGKIVSPNWIPEKRRRFFSQVKYYFWDEPYAFKLCSDNVMRRCVAGSEILEILAHCHSGPTGGHHSASITGRKVYEPGFY